MALILTRKSGQGFWIGDAYVRVTKRGERELHVLVDAPRSVAVVREEIDARPIPRGERSA